MEGLGTSDSGSTPTQRSATFADRFDIGEPIGEGAMARVYDGVMKGQGGFRRPVALKIIHQIDPKEAASAARALEREANLLSRNTHPHIVQVLDLTYTDEGLVCMVMERLEGADLMRLLLLQNTSGRLLPTSVVVDIFVQTCRGLHHAHELKQANGQPMDIVHRDIKPSNIFVTKAGIVKVMDFGIGRANTIRRTTLHGSTKGTPQFMSPEQATGQDLDRRSDVWALGALLFELVTGDPLIEGATLSEVLLNIVQGQFHETIAERVMSLDPSRSVFIGIIEKATADNPADRYQTAKAMMKAVRAVGASGPDLAEWLEGDVSELLFDEIDQGEETSSLPSVPVGTISMNPPTNPGVQSIGLSGIIPLDSAENIGANPERSAVMMSVEDPGSGPVWAYRSENDVPAAPVGIESLEPPSDSKEGLVYDEASGTYRQATAREVGKTRVFTAQDASKGPGKRTAVMALALMAMLLGAVGVFALLPSKTPIDGQQAVASVTEPLAPVELESEITMPADEFSSMPPKATPTPTPTPKVVKRDTPVEAKRSVTPKVVAAAPTPSPAPEPAPAATGTGKLSMNLGVAARVRGEDIDFYADAPFMNREIPAGTHRLSVECVNAANCPEGDRTITVVIHPNKATKVIDRY